MHVFGSRYVFSILLALAGIATALLGPLAKLSPILMTPARLVQGVTLASVMPLMGSVTANYAPEAEIGKFMTFLSASSQLAILFTMPLNAILCIKTGWTSAFAVIGILSVVAALLFFLFYRNSPDKHPLMKEEEIKYIGGWIFLAFLYKD
jgi:MFS family permease